MRYFILTLLVVCTARADLVIFENGDRLSGKVLTLSEKELKLQTEVQGTVTLPRDKVATIHLKEPAGARGAVGAVPNAGSILQQLQKGGDSSSAIDEVENNLLAGASPEAQQMYRSMVQDLMSGKLQLGDIRSQAESTLKELRSLQNELDDDGTSELLGSYAAILENFLKATPPSAGTPKAAPAPKAETTE